MSTLGTWEGLEKGKRKGLEGEGGEIMQFHLNEKLISKLLRMCLFSQLGNHRYVSHNPVSNLPSKILQEIY